MRPLVEYVVAIDLRSPSGEWEPDLEGLFDDDRLDHLIHLLYFHHCIVHGTGGGFGATFNVHAEDARHAVEVGVRLIRRAAAIAGFPDWPPGRIEVMTYFEQEQELAAAGLSELAFQAPDTEGTDDWFQGGEASQCDLCRILRSLSHRDACAVCLVN